jgi:uncharacterized protein YjdB
VQLTAAVSPEDAANKALTWSSSDPSKATVSGSGVVTGVAVGSATITATSADGPSGTATVTVKPVPVESVTLTGTNVTQDAQGKHVYLAKNATTQLDVTVNPANATDTSVTWTSSDPSKATVSANGLVSPVANGTAIITVKSNFDSTKTDSCIVTVSDPVHLTSISLNESTLNLNKGGTGNLTVTYTPADTTDLRAITWTSSDTSVATVHDGVVTAVGGGTATITATSAVNNTITATCTVTVNVPLVSISLNRSTLNLNRGANETLTVTYNPSDTTDSQAITWTSSNTSVATVSTSGEVTATGGGTTVITATSAANNTITAACAVTVTVPLESISLNETNLSLSKNDTRQLSVTYNPTDTTQPKTVTWSSNNTSVATVSSSGQVTATGGGTATITATSAANNTITAACVVTVTVPLVSISLPNTMLLGLPGSTHLTVTYNPADTTEKGVDWSSSDDSVATVHDGVVTAVGGGTAIITATSTANGIQTTCTVTVDHNFTAGINVNMDFQDEEITLNEQFTSEYGFEYLVFTAPSGYRRYNWFTDGIAAPSETGNLLRYNLAYNIPGNHTVTVIVEKDDGSHFSKSVYFTLGY